MGYGRAGWYSYDRLDMKGRSADEILPEHQSLAVGDTVPTDPGGGFVVRRLDPGRALVLGVDEEILARRTPATASAAEAPGLAASGRFLETAVPPRFRASWAFLLEPAPGGGTRLIERFRAWFGEETPASKVMGPMLGFGLFVMIRRQLLGIRERAERHPVPPVPAPAPAPADGVADGPGIAPDAVVAPA
jgi:hypothetical protein